MSYPTNDRRGIKTFQIRLLKESLVNPLGMIPLLDDDVLEFSEIPPRIIVNKSAVYVDETVPGRTEPWKNYSHSNPTRVSFTAKLVAMGGQGFSGSISSGIAGAGLSLASRVGSKMIPNVTLRSPDFPGPAGRAASTAFQRASGLIDLPTIFIEVHKKADWLIALTYAQYDQHGRAFPPPLVELVNGANFTMRGVVKDVTLNYVGPWEVNTILSMEIECTVEFEEVNLTPKGYLEVRNRWNPLSGGLNNFVPTGQDAIGAARSIFGL